MHSLILYGFLFQVLLTVAYSVIAGVAFLLVKGHAGHCGSLLLDDVVGRATGVLVRL